MSVARQSASDSIDGYRTVTPMLLPCRALLPWNVQGSFPPEHSTKQQYLLFSEDPAPARIPLAGITPRSGMRPVSYKSSEKLPNDIE